MGWWRTKEKKIINWQIESKSFFFSFFFFCVQRSSRRWQLLAHCLSKRPCQELEIPRKEHIANIKNKEEERIKQFNQTTPRTNSPTVSVFLLVLGNLQDALSFGHVSFVIPPKVWVFDSFSCWLVLLGIFQLFGVSHSSGKKLNVSHCMMWPMTTLRG